MSTTTRKFTTVAAAISIAVGVTFTLGGCFGNPLEGLAQGGANEIIKQATGGDVDINIGGKSLPKDFPSQVPLPNGEILSAGSITSDGDTMWTVQMNVDDPQIFEKIQAEMAKAGFEEDFSSDGEMRMGSYTGNGYGVIVSVSTDDGQTMVNYMIGPDDNDD